MRIRWKIVFMGALLLLLMSAGAAVLAQTSASYRLGGSVIGSGGEATSAGYRLQGTAGQAISGPTTGRSGDELYSGFWVVAAPSPTATPQRSYLPSLKQ